VEKTFKHLRDHPPKEICGLPVVETLDFTENAKTVNETNEAKEIGGDLCRMVGFTLANGYKVFVRPKGNQFGLKYYASGFDLPFDSNLAVSAGNRQKLEDIINFLKNY
jgi:hypothetical protein